MAKFKVTLLVSELHNFVKEVEVEADTVEEAEALAVEQVEDEDLYEPVNVEIESVEVESGSTKQIEE